MFCPPFPMIHQQRMDLHSGFKFFSIYLTSTGKSLSYWFIQDPFTGVPFCSHQARRQHFLFHSEAHNSRYLFMYECNRISLKLNSTHLTQLKAIHTTKCNMLRRRGKPPARILGVLGHCQFRGWGPKYAQTSLTRYRKLFLKKVHLTAMSLILFNWWCGNGSKPIPRNLQIPERGFTLCFTRCSFF